MLLLDRYLAQPDENHVFYVSWVTKVTSSQLRQSDFCINNQQKIILMAQHEIETQWMGKMQFNALVNGHTIVMDAPPRAGGEENGPIPKPFILTALSGCTGMDVVALLRKANLAIDDFSLKVTGELSKQQPLEYIAIHIVYDIKGKDADRDAVLKAVNDSQEKICGVSHMLKKALPITWDINFNGEEIFSNQPMQTEETIAQPIKN